MSQPPLNWQASADPTNPTISSSLPPEVIACLKNARFLHLATCTNQIPHISLMNYTYLPSTPYSSSPTIIMTTNASSRKTLNLLSNPSVSLLVHDWISHRPNNATTSGSPPPSSGRSSSLASMLLNMNTAALGRISTTITGTARILESGEEETWCREQHVENHKFGDTESGGNTEGACFIEGEDVKVIVVVIKEGRISDWKGGVKDWEIEESSDQQKEEQLVNGV